MKLTPRKILSLFVICTTLLAATHFYLDWRIPRATAALEILPPSGGIYPQRKNGPLDGVPAPRSWMENKIKKGTSGLSLKMAFAKISPNTTPTQKQIVELRDCIMINPRRGTDFLEFTAKHQNRKQAVLIANAFASVFLERETAKHQQYADTIETALNKELETHTKLVAEAKKNLTPPTSSEATESLRLATENLLEIKALQKKDRALLKEYRNHIFYNLIEPAK